MHSQEHDPPIIRRRQVFHIAGYDPVTPEEQYQRFIQQLAVFKRTWGVEVAVATPKESSNCFAWTVDVSGANWHVHTHYELWNWDDIIRKNAQRSSISRLVNATVTYVDLLFSGTLYRYLKANFRYFVFSIVPLLEIALFVGVAGFVGWFVVRTVGLNGVASSAGTFAIGLTVFSLLLHWPGRCWRMQQAFDDWIFSREYLRGRRGDMEVRLAAFRKGARCARPGT